MRQHTQQPKKKQRQLSFKIEQLALKLNPFCHDLALQFLADCGITDWVEDTVHARGFVAGSAAFNVAKLRFNYDAFAGKELEVLQYEAGNNWLAGFDAAIVSHIGMHCGEHDLPHWFALMAKYNIEVIQEVFTEAHTNEAIKDSRRYHYVIFNTRGLIGTDMKFIVRRKFTPGPQETTQ
jgi:hypothetical protein